jgi:1,4-dihydroxy-2-naphthoate octaprenyltransferase
MPSSSGISSTTAFSTVAKVTPAQWQATSIAARWIIAARAGVLVMTFSSASLGGVLALVDGSFDGLRWLVCVAGLLLAHATNNMLNDLTDSARGIDEGNYFRVQYGAHVLEDGLQTRGQLWVYTWVTGLAALGFATWLVWQAGTVILYPLVPGALLLLFYTWPLKHWGLGEIAVLVVWGPLMVGGTYLTVTGVWRWEAAMIGCLFALGPTSVIFGKHIDKLEFDAAKHVLTLPVRLGEKRSRLVVQTMTVLLYIGLLALVGAGGLPWMALIALGALPEAIRLMRVLAQPRPSHRPDDFPASAWPLWFVAFAFVHTRRFGLLFLAGMLASWLLAAAA